MGAEAVAGKAVVEHLICTIYGRSQVGRRLKETLI